MKTKVLYSTLALAALCLLCGSDWLQFRGSDNNPTSDAKNLPKQFDAASGQNVAWKAPLPGRGPAGPIVVAGRVVVTCSSGSKQDRLHVLVFDVASGKLLWQRRLWATGHTVCNPFGAVAAPTPASDGKRIFAFYSSNDLACFDLDGNLLWFRGLAYDYPTARNDNGMASSPLVLGDTVIVQMENQGESFVAGLDVSSGQTRWRVPRDHDAIWASPTVLRGKTRADDVVLLQGRTKLLTLQPSTGKPLWDFEIDCHTTASAVTHDGDVYLPAHGLNALRFDPTEKAAKLLWHQLKLRSGSGSAAIHEGRAYVIKGRSILVCADLANGEVLWQLRLKGPIWGTPALADGHIYAVNHEGLVQIVELGEKGRLVGTGQIEPGVLASPAVSDGAVFFRTDAHLWKIANTTKSDTSAK